MAEQDQARPPKLTSWKEIGAYLGVTARTAQVWEKQRGLPVQRLPGARSRVEADVRALDEWRNSETKGLAELAGQEPRRIRWSVIAACGAALVLVLALVGGVLRTMRRPHPAAVRVMGNTVTALDSDDRVLWRRVFPYVLSPGEYLPVHTDSNRWAWFGDLDGDGRTEVLLVATALSEEGTAPLVCFSDDGEERWRYSTTRVVASAREQFAARYGVDAVLPVPAANGRPGRVYLTSNHYRWFPSQVVRLSARGALEKEYWHSGQLHQIALRRHGGREELLVGGINQRHKQATVVVLDAEEFGGASDEEGAEVHQILAGGKAREVMRLLLPASCASRTQNPYNWVQALTVRPGLVEVSTWEDRDSNVVALHVFNDGFTMHDVTFSDKYRLLHQELERKGRVDHAYNDTEVELVRQCRFLVPYR